MLVATAIVVGTSLGCGPAIDLGNDASGSSADGSTGPATISSGTTAEPPPGTTAEPPPGTTAERPDTTTGADSGGALFLDGGLDFGGPPSCDPFEQDCGEGEKCVPWSSDGSPEWNATRCVPILGMGEADDPCTTPNGPYGGFDTCGFGLMCWTVDPGTNEGTCIPLCGDFGGGLGCNDPDRLCFTSGEVLAVCAYACDPLLVDCTEAGDGCYPVTDGFVCLPDESGDMGAPGGPCEAVNSCDPGAACLDAAAVPDCPASRCCSAFCELTEPMPSCLPGQMCTSWYRDDPWGLDLGICVSSM